MEKPWNCVFEFLFEPCTLEFSDLLPKHTSFFYLALLKILMKTEIVIDIFQYVS